MQFDMNEIKKDYEYAKGWREAGKWAFAIGTLGLGGLYLWATTSIIKEGQIGLRSNYRGEMILLPPGRHSNFPWENYPVPPQSLATKIINLGPYKIITVDTSFVAKTFNHGKLEILTEGQHLIKDASHVFDGFIPVKQETKRLKEVNVSTSDNVGLTLHADVRYQIFDPEAAIRQIDGIETSIEEIAEMSISQIVGHHTMLEFAPATSYVLDDKSKGKEKSSGSPTGMGEVIVELTNRIKEQFSQLGITLLSIGITSWTVNSKELAHELAQGAVIQSQTQSKMLAAQRAAEIVEIEARADAKATEIRAEGTANAIKKEGKAIKEIADELKDHPVAQKIYENKQKVDLVRNADKPFLFFSQPGMGNQDLPQVTLPLQEFSSRSTTLIN